MAASDMDYNALCARYTSKVDTDAVAAIVKYCGPALRSNDSKYVAASDKAETGRIVKGFCAKKLGLGADAATSAVAAAADKMKADRMKHRVPFYYLISEHAGKLGALSGKATAAKTSARKAAAKPPAAAPKPAPQVAVAPAVSLAPKPAAPAVQPLAAMAAPAVAKLDVAAAKPAQAASAPTYSNSRWYMRGSYYDHLTSRSR
jgi:hypothetical protein